MRLRRTQGDENPGPVTTLHGSAPLPFVISTEAQRSGEISVLMLRLGNVLRPERSCACGAPKVMKTQVR